MTKETSGYTPYKNKNTGQIVLAKAANGGMKIDEGFELEGKKLTLLMLVEDFNSSYEAIDAN